MLGKLLKYEVKSTAKTYLPILAAFLVLSVFERLFMNVGETEIIAFDILGGLVTAAFFIIIIFVLPCLPIVSGAMRFGKNLLGNEGYLTNTLPVKTSTHILAKIIASFIWIFGCVIAAISALLILFLGSEQMEEIISGFREAFDLLSEAFSNNPLLVLLIIITVITAYISSLMLIYASICIGHLANSGRKIKGVLAFVGLSIGSSIVMSTIMQILDASGTLSSLDTIDSTYASMWVMIVNSVVLSAVYYLITHNVLKKHLNLE